MANKRFTLLNKDVENIKSPICENDKLLNYSTVCNLLNELYEGNDYSKLSETIIDLETEISHLKDWKKECEARKEIIKEKLRMYFDLCEKYNVLSADEMDTYIQRLKAENSELKRELLNTGKI